MASQAATDADDIGQIQDLQRRFAQLNDAARWDEVAALFTEDGRFTRPSDPAHPIVGRTAILQTFLARSAAPPRRHLVADPVIESLDGTTAHARCTSILLTCLGEGSGTISLGYFQDELAKTGEGWRFKSRVGSTAIPPAPCDMHELLCGPASAG